MAEDHGFGNVGYAVGHGGDQRVNLGLVQVLDQHDAVINVGDDHHKADSERHQERHSERAVDRRDDFPQIVMQRTDYLQNRLLAAQKREHLQTRQVCRRPTTRVRLLCTSPRSPPPPRPPSAARSGAG